MFLWVVLVFSCPLHPNGKTKKDNSGYYNSFHYFPPFLEMR